MTTRRDLRSALVRSGRSAAHGVSSDRLRSRPGPASWGRGSAGNRSSSSTGRPGAGPAGPPTPARHYRYGRLLVILVFTYLLSAFTRGLAVSTIQVVLFLAVVLLALRSGRLRKRTARIIAVGLLAGSAAATALQLVDHNGPGAGVANIWTALVLLLAIGFILQRVLSQPEITLQSIYGAVSAYMILGLTFAAIYSAMFHFGGNHFFAPGEMGNTQTFQYFSFTTLTTLGYGDFTAGGSGGQAVAVIEAMAGQLFLGILIARLVASFRVSATGAARRNRNRPAKVRRATIRRASAPGMIRLRPPGTVRGRPPSASRPAGRTGTGPDPEPATRRGARRS